MTSRNEWKNALPPERARHHVFATQIRVLTLRRGENLAAHGGAQAVRRMTGHIPAAWTAGEFGPVLGRVRHVGRLVDLLHLGGVFGDEAVRLDEIGEDIVARPVAADAPL